MSDEFFSFSYTYYIIQFIIQLAASLAYFLDLSKY